MRAAATTFASRLLGAAAAAFGLWLIVAATTLLTTATTAAAALVNMTVRNFFFGRGTHFLNRDFEIQMLTGKRVICLLYTSDAADE